MHLKRRAIKILVANSKSKTRLPRRSIQRLNVGLNPVQQGIDIAVEKLAISEGGSLQFHYEDITATIHSDRASRSSRFGAESPHPVRRPHEESAILGDCPDSVKVIKAV